MPQIIAENLTKCFKISERQPGIGGAMRGLVKRTYREIRALDDVSFTINEGDLVGYIGPNGAGKSTTIKIISGVLVPSSGRCEILGRTPWKQRIEHVREIGVVFGQRTQLWWDLPVIESFELLRDIYNVSLTSYKTSMDELTALLSLESLMDVPVRQLSLGQRTRCDLAAALLHAPRILFLDEPTIGLDAISKLAVRDFIKQLNRDRGVTVILTTHDMDDIEALCSRLMLIGKGKILLDGTLDDLRSRVSRERHLIIDLPTGNGDFSHPHARVISDEGGQVRMAFDPDKISAAKLIADITAAHDISDLYVENPPIEQIIARFYKEEIH